MRTPIFIPFSLMVLMVFLLPNCKRPVPVKIYKPISVVKQEPVVEPVVSYVRYANTPLRTGSSDSDQASGYLDKFEQIYVRPNSSKAFWEVTYPDKGFVNHSLIFSEQEMNDFLQNEFDYQQELENVSNNLTPYQHILDYPDSLPAFSLDRDWSKSYKYRTSYVRATFVDVFRGPSHTYVSYGQIPKNSKLIIDTRYKLKANWVKTVYPIKGYVNKNCLYSKKHIQDLLEEQKILVNEIRLALGLNPITEPEPKRRIFKRKTPTIIPYVASTEIKQQDPPQENIRDRLERSIQVGRLGQKLLPDSTFSIEWTELAGSELNQYTDLDTMDIFATHADDGNKLRITALGALSPYYIPMDHNFTKLGIPYGGSIEFSKQKWPVSFGLGFNSMRAQTNSMVYILQANDIFVFGKYIPLKLFNEKLELFLTAGGTAWSAQILNVKYPEHEEYYPTNIVRGYSYTGGVGTLFEFHKFLFGLQYQLYGTPVVIIGEDYNEPDTQEGLDDFVPTTQYKLYAGSNQLQITIGYRIN